MIEHPPRSSPGHALDALADTARLLADASFDDVLAMVPALVIRAIPVASRAELRVTRPGQTRSATSSAERNCSPAAAALAPHTRVLSLEISLDAVAVAGELLLSTQAAEGFEGIAAVTAEILASQVEAALDRAHARETAGELQSGLASNRDIGTAIGLVMASQGLDREAAFEVLGGISQNTNRKLVAVVADVIRVGESGARPPRLRLVGPRQVRADRFAR